MFHKPLNFAFISVLTSWEIHFEKTSSEPWPMTVLGGFYGCGVTNTQATRGSRRLMVWLYIVSSSSLPACCLLDQLTPGFSPGSFSSALLLQSCGNCSDGSVERTCSSTPGVHCDKNPCDYKSLLKPQLWQSLLSVMS